MVGVMPPPIKSIKASCGRYGDTEDLLHSWAQVATSPPQSQNERP